MRASGKEALFFYSVLKIISYIHHYRLGMSNQLLLLLNCYLLKVFFLLIKPNRWSGLHVNLFFLKKLIGKYGMIYIIREWGCRG
ncbi:hypothetical protein VK94_12240 [Bacillus sp. LK7]|nr:hypothetical protein VK94_12240 [Bacillus sp. LK7]